ncbi:hypothetical protein C8J57DRAFT_1373211 [Mycena rebaudengoi]|nr:hypothetical protein C8J57DRAFT_1373211 [Mycena rebaudengoi]
MRSPLLIKLLRLINRVGLVSGRPWTRLLAPVMALIRKLISQPQVAELFRFIFLGTIVETGRQMAQWISDFTRDCEIYFHLALISPPHNQVKAEFVMGDFAYDWVVNYLENHRVWNESRSFMVVARNAATRPYPKSNLGKIDGHPDPLYEPATSQSPSLFRWKGYWMSVKGPAGWSHYDTSGYGSGGSSGTLVLAVWSRNRHVLDEFVAAARDFYVNSEVLPRKQFNVKSELSESLLTAHFNQGDLSYDWILEFLRSSDAFKDIMELNVTTKQSDLGWGAGPKDSVRYTPAPDSMQRLLYTSPRSGKGTWVQVVIQSGALAWDSSRIAGGAITLTLHSSDREVLSDLINSAKEKYLEQGTSRVSVHLTNNHGSWAKAVTKSRRALSTLVLPADTKEMILADAQEFLASEKTYTMAGIPHRRDGAPGTGKSSTVHAIAGELGLEIYFISLANPEINDYSLGRLISDTPSRSILLLEDIDCAFPSREEPDEDEDEEPRRDHDGNIIKPTHNMVPAKSAVTLSGLLNVLDSVSSEEGRLTFATTNHIENLDPALIRAGRMDLKIKYSLATTAQIKELFRVFFSVIENEGPGAKFPSYTAAEIEHHAAEFAATMPPDMYSIAQIQGYLLRKKRNPVGAIQGVTEWLTEQEEDRRAIVEAKRRWQLARRSRAECEGANDLSGPRSPGLFRPRSARGSDAG